MAASGAKKKSSKKTVGKAPVAKAAPKAAAKPAAKPKATPTPTPTPTSARTRSAADIEGERWVQLAVIAGGGLLAAVIAFFVIGALLRRKPRPPYIPASVFASALMDSLVDTVAPDSPDRQKLMAELGNVAISLPPEYDDLKRSLVTLIDSAAGDVGKIREALEKWFNDTMERVAGWYKRLAQKITVGIAVTIALVTNADMLMVANSLYADSNTRVAVSAAAAEAVRGALPGTNWDTLVSVNAALTRVDLTTLPVGWQADRRVAGDARAVPLSLDGWLVKLAGIAFTVVAVSMGSPFWFNVLGNIVRLRIDGEPPSASSTRSQ